MKTFDEWKSIPTIEDGDKEFYGKYVEIPDNQQFIWRTSLADYTMIKVNAKYAVMLRPDSDKFYGNIYRIYRAQTKTFNAVSDGGIVVKYNTFVGALDAIKQIYDDKF